MLISVTLQLNKPRNINNNWIFRWAEVKPRTKYILHNFTPKTFSMPLGKNKERTRQQEAYYFTNILSPSTFFFLSLASHKLFLMILASHA